MARRAALHPVADTPASDADAPEPPGGLGGEAAEWWRQVVAEWRLAPDELALLEQACQALDRVMEVRAAIDADGLMVDSLHGDGQRLHPAYVVERDSRLAFGRLVKQLALPHAKAPRGPLALTPRRW